MSTQPEPGNRRDPEPPAANPLENDNQPWFIRQVRTGRIEFGDDNVLPMRMPPPVPTEALSSGGFADRLGDDREADDQARDVHAIDDGELLREPRPAPGDAGWLDWTAPAATYTFKAPERGSLPRSLLIGLAFLAVLLAFGAGWALHAWTSRGAAPVPVAQVAPVAAPVVPVVRKASPRSAPPVVEKAVPRPPKPVARETVRPREVVKPTSRTDTAPRTTAVSKKAAAEPVSRKLAEPVVRKPSKARDSDGTLRPKAKPVVTKAKPVVKSRSRPDSKAPVKPREPKRPIIPHQIVIAPPPTGVPTDLLAEVDPGAASAKLEAEQRADDRAIERVRDREQRKVRRTLPRCVGFQVYRPNVACRVGGPR